jgi:predicted porin
MRSCSLSLAPTMVALAVALNAGHALAQSSSTGTVTLYGRVDLSLAQQADAVKNREVRNGSGSRLGVRGEEDLGGGMKAFFQLEHRFNANNGTQSTDRFWEGKAVVGVDSGFGRVWLGREENPAYTLGQTPADPWGTDTVAGNGSIINGRIGSTRYSSTANYRFSAAGFTVAGQIAEAEPNAPASGGVIEDRPYSVGLGYRAGPLVLGVGFENPSDADDSWATFLASYTFGIFKIGGLIGRGRNVSDQKHESYLVSATTTLGAGELRLSYGQLKNKSLDRVADKQLGLGYHHAVSKRTTLYADFVNERRDGIGESGREKNGYDVGIKHNF